MITINVLVHCCVVAKLSWVVASVFWLVTKVLPIWCAVVTVFCVVVRVLLVCFGRLSRHYYVVCIATIHCFVHCCAVARVF